MTENRAPKRAALRVALTVLCVAYAIALARHAAKGVGGSDTSGYFNAAVMLAHGQIALSEPFPELRDLPSYDLQWFVPLGFVLRDAHSFGLFYPIGFPLHIALVGAIFGFKTLPYYLSPLAVVLSVILLYRLVRSLGGDRTAATLAAIFFAFCPVLIFQGMLAMSDVVAAMWCLAAVLLALRAERVAPRRWLPAIAVGVCIGIAVLVRPTNLLIALPCIIALRGRKELLARVVIGGLPFAVLLAWYNRTVFGAFTRSGYSIGGAVSDFQLANFPPRSLHYAKWTAAQLGLVLATWLLSLCLPWTSRRIRLLLAVWLGSFFLLYSFYGPYDAWWYTRFLLPAYPAIVAGAFAGLSWMRAQNKRATIALFVIWTISVATAIELDRYWRVIHLNGVLKDQTSAITWVSRLVPPGSPVLSMEFSGALLYYTHLIPVRWDLIPMEDLERFAEASQKKQRYLYAFLMPHEVEQLNPSLRSRLIPLGEKTGGHSLWAYAYRARGFVEQQRGNIVAGWACDPSPQAPPTHVRLIARQKGKELAGASHTASLSRPDLIKAHVASNAAHGFQLDIAELALSPGTYEIAVEMIDTPSRRWVTVPSLTSTQMHYEVVRSLPRS